MLRRAGLPVRMEDSAFFLDNVSDENVIRAVRLCVEAGFGVLRVTEQQKSLEDIFLSLTGKQVSL